MGRVKYAILALIFLAIAFFPSAVSATSHTTGLSAAYSFDEGSGPTVNDSSGNGNTGTISGATWGTGFYGNALSFDGVSNLVNLGSQASLDNVNTFTYTAWIYPRTLGGNSRGQIASKGSDPTFSKKFNLYPNNALSCNVPASTMSATAISANNEITLNTWQFVACTFMPGSSPRLWHALSGQNVSEATPYGLSRAETGTITSEAANDFRIGDTTGGTQAFNGIIDDVRIYNRVLTLAELQTVMNSPVGGETPPPPPPPSSAPTAPTNLAASAVSSTQIDLSWTDTSSNEDGFRIERRTGAGSYSQIASVGVNVVTYQDTSVSPSTTYTYRVYAYNAAGNSGYSNEATATTPASPPPPPPPPPPSGSAPTAPREVNCRGITSTSVECFWFPSRDDEGVTYRIYRGRVTAWNGQSYPAAWDSQTLIGTSPNDGMGRVGFIDTGLTPAIDYIYWVSAVDPQGSESTRVTTTHSAPTTLFSGSTISTSITTPTSVTVGQTITIQQTINCNPSCTIGHHDVHWGTNMNNLPSGSGDNFGGHSIQDGTAATTRTSTFTNTPTATQNFYFMEDGHVVGSGYPRNGGCSGGCEPHKEGMLFRVVVTNGNPLTINPPTLPNPSVGVAYSQALSASGEGSGSYNWGIYEGRLPPGLTINTATGLISGTPTTAGTYTFGVMIEETMGGITAFRTYTLVVGGCPTTRCFYIDINHPSASDTNPGTEDLPWRTLQRINTATFAPGDTVYAKAGTYSVTSGGSGTNPAVAPNQAGTASAPIVVAVYPGHTVIVDGGGNTNNAVMGARTSYVTVRGFIIRNAGGWCINVAGGSATSRITGVIVEHIDCNGITGTTVNNAAGFRLFHVEGTTIRNNTVHNEPYIGDGTNVAGIFLHDGRNNIVENNEIYSFWTGIFDKYASQQNNIFRRNYLHDLRGNGILFSCFGEGHDGTNFCQSGQIYENIVTNSQSGITAGQTYAVTNFRDFIVYSNTLYNLTNVGIMSGGASTNFRNWNNIVWITGTLGALEVGGLTQSNYNDFYPRQRFVLYSSPSESVTYSTLSAWQSGTGFDLNSLASDPLFVGPLTGSPPPSAFRLQSTSPLRGAGRTGGVASGSPVDIGAYPTGNECIGTGCSSGGTTRCDQQANYGQSCTTGTGACQRSGTYVCNDPSSTSETPHCSATAGSPTTETCNGVDDDCDGVVDDGVSTTYYRDLDTDTYGNATNTQSACSLPSGYVTNSGDCNDNNANVNPGRTEVCNNGIDDNCNSLTDCSDSACSTNPSCTQANQTCSQQGGFVCDHTQKCDGQLLNASDTSTCCSQACRNTPGDCTDDNVVNVFDLTFVGSRFGNRPGDVRWDVRADEIIDNVIDVQDLDRVSANMGNMY